MNTLFSPKKLSKLGGAFTMRGKIFSMTSRQNLRGLCGAKFWVIIFCRPAHQAPNCTVCLTLLLHVRRPIWRYSTAKGLGSGRRCGVPDAVWDAELYHVSPISQQQVWGAINMRGRKTFWLGKWGMRPLRSVHYEIKYGILQIHFALFLPVLDPCRNIYNWPTVL